MSVSRPAKCRAWASRASSDTPLAASCSSANWRIVSSIENRVELTNLRAAFRWAADHRDVDVAAPIAIYGTILGNKVGNYEPIGWAEELIEPARAVDHPRLGALYEMASICYFVGRIEAAVGYSDAGRTLLSSGRDYELPFGGEGVLGGPYVLIGQPERAVEWCRTQLARGRDTHAVTQTQLVVAPPPEQLTRR